MLLGEHAVVYGFSCLVSTVGVYLTATVKKSAGPKDLLTTPGVSNNSFVKNAIGIFRTEFNLLSSVSVATASGLTGYGLGSSAAATVAVLKSLSGLFGPALTPGQLFDLSYKSVLSVQKTASGFDLAAVIYGGTLCFNGATKKIDRLPDIGLPLLIVYSGRKVPTVSLIKKVQLLQKNKPKIAAGIFKRINKIVTDGKKAIEAKNWPLLGRLMSENHSLLRKLGVSTPALDSLVAAAVSAGAYGAKLSGAGGGDCIIVLAPSEIRNKIARAVIPFGGQIINAEIPVKGAEVI